MLEQDRPTHAEIGAVDDHAVDVTADAPAGDREAELFAVPPFVAQVEAREPQPADGHVFELMPGLEDAEHPTVEAFSVIDRRIGEFEDKLACAGLANAAAAEIVARRLLAVLLDQRAVDQRVDALAGGVAWRLAAIDKTRIRD